MPKLPEDRTGYEHDAHDPNFDLDSTGHLYIMPMEDQEREIEHMSRYDAVSERFADTRETGDDYVPDAEEIAEMDAAHEVWCRTEGAHSFWYPRYNTPSDSMNDPNDIPF